MKINNSLESALSQLCNLPRTGWLIRGVERPETVADHTFGTLLIAMITAEFTSLKKGFDSFEEILSMSVIHDLAEIYLGDLTPRTKKYLSLNNPELTHSSLENKFFNEFVKILPDLSKEFFLKTWDQLSQKKTSFAAQIPIIDIVEMLGQAYEYEKTGQRKLDEFWRWVPNCQGDDFLFQFAKTIQRRRNFLKVNSGIKYQHFESAEHHRSLEFAKKIIQLDPNNFTKRDEIIRGCFCRHSKDGEHYRILDVGCGMASFSRYFLEDKKGNFDVTGIDINSYLLEQAKERWKDSSFNTLPATDVGWYWNLDSMCYDVVLVGEVLEHVFDPCFVLMEAFRVLKPGGQLFISVPNSFHQEKKERMLQEHRIELRFKEEHIRYFGPENLLELINENGFIVDELFGLDKKWEKIINLNSNELDIQGKFYNSDICWTLVFSARKATKDEIKNIGLSKTPGKNENVQLLQTRIDEHQKTKELTKLHEFIEELNKAKLLRVNQLDESSETIAQQTFRLAILAICIAAEMNLNIGRMIGCILMQGLVETHLAELLPQIRITFDHSIRIEALKDVLSPLPDDIKHYYVSFYSDDYLRTTEGKVAKYLINRDFLSLGVKVPSDEIVLDIEQVTNFKTTIKKLFKEVDI